jgi:hypothetical protein
LGAGAHDRNRPSPVDERAVRGRGNLFRTQRQFQTVIDRYRFDLRVAARAVMIEHERFGGIADACRRLP